ncbi:MAG: DUF2493 domain-containing protein [Ruminococcus sp.]|nr:DUF2493 domain-containing protein [Ruminococcus sp.]
MINESQSNGADEHGFRVLIAGSRTFNDYPLLCEEMKNFYRVHITEIVCGMAKGADSLGEKWAREHRVKVTYFPALWDKYGKSAGIIRNHQMGDYADFLLAFWDGESHGTKDMIEYMKKLGKHGRVVIFED